MKPSNHILEAADMAGVSDGDDGSLDSCIICCAGSMLSKASLIQVSTVDTQTVSAYHPDGHRQVVYGDVGILLPERSPHFQVAYILRESFAAHGEVLEKRRSLYSHVITGNRGVLEAGLEGAANLSHWDMSREHEIGLNRSSEDSGPRHLGLWQFRSITLLQPGIYGLRTEPNLQDDLEAFHWVLMYLVMRYRPVPSWSPRLIQFHLVWLFGEHIWDYNLGIYAGGNYKRLCLLTGRVGYRDLMDSLTVPPPVHGTIQMLLSVFGDFYSKKSDAINRLSNHAYFQSILSNHLAEFDLSGFEPDPAEDQIADLTERTWESYEEGIP